MFILIFCLLLLKDLNYLTSILKELSYKWYTSNWYALVTSSAHIQVPNINNNFSRMTHFFLLILTVFFPVLAVIDDKWVRYKVLLIGSLIIMISCTALWAIKMTKQFIHINDTIMSILSTIVTCPYIFDLILFLDNFIQLGTDQLHFHHLKSWVGLYIGVFGLTT